MSDEHWKDVDSLILTQFLFSTATSEKITDQEDKKEKQRNVKVVHYFLIRYV